MEILSVSVTRWEDRQIYKYNMEFYAPNKNCRLHAHDNRLEECR